jgi:hypothetical protein
MNLQSAYELSRSIWRELNPSVGRGQKAPLFPSRDHAPTTCRGDGLTATTPTERT